MPSFAGTTGTTSIVNTDDGTVRQVYTGSVDPNTAYSVKDNDLWITSLGAKIWVDGATPVWVPVAAVASGAIVNTDSELGDILYSGNTSPEAAGATPVDGDAWLNLTGSYLRVNGGWIKSGNRFPVTLAKTVSETEDLRGIIAWFGTQGFTQAFQNPAGQRDLLHKAGVIEVTQSSIGNAVKLAENAVDGTVDDFYTLNLPDSWWMADFKTKTVLVEKCSIRARASGGRNVRNFKIQESYDATTWRDIATIVNEGPVDNTWFNFDCAGATQSRYIRVLNTGPNEGGDNFLIMGEIEMWGSIDTTPTAVSFNDPQDNFIQEFPPAANAQAVNDHTATSVTI